MIKVIFSFIDLDLSCTFSILSVRIYAIIHPYTHERKQVLHFVITSVQHYTYTNEFINGLAECH